MISHLYLVTAMNRFHRGLTHTFQHESVTHADGDQGQQVDSQEGVKNVSPLLNERGKFLGAVCLWTEPERRLCVLIQCYRHWKQQRTCVKRYKKNLYYTTIGTFIFTSVLYDKMNSCQTNIKSIEIIILLKLIGMIFIHIQIVVHTDRAICGVRWRRDCSG